MLDWLRCRLFVMQMRYCSCEECYGRFLFREPSWTLQLAPTPGVRMYFETCEAGYRVGIMWFRLVVYKRPYQQKR